MGTFYSALGDQISWTQVLASMESPASCIGITTLRGLTESTFADSNNKCYNEVDTTLIALGNKSATNTLLSQGGDAYSAIQTGLNATGNSSVSTDAVASSVSDKMQEQSISLIGDNITESVSQQNYNMGNVKGSLGDGAQLPFAAMTTVVGPYVSNTKLVTDNISQIDIIGSAKMYEVVKDPLKTSLIDNASSVLSQSIPNRDSVNEIGGFMTKQIPSDAAMQTDQKETNDISKKVLADITDATQSMQGWF